MIANSICRLKIVTVANHVNNTFIQVVRFPLLVTDNSWDVRLSVATHVEGAITRDTMPLMKENNSTAISHRGKS